jgi:hypothetical protein
MTEFIAMHCSEEGKGTSSGGFLQYRKRIIQLTKKTGDLFSPAKLHKPLRKHAVRWI